MYTMNEMINEMESLKGANVRVFGQPVTLSNECDDFTIDIVDLLKELSDYECKTFIDYEGEDEEIDIFEGCEDCDDKIEALVRYGFIKDECDYKGDNSYNWNSPINHDFDIKIYDDFSRDGEFVVLKCHRYGDVRCNYTDEVLLHFDSRYDFIETLMGCRKYFNVEVDGIEYDCDIECTSEYVSVWCESTGEQYELYACDIEDLKDEIRKAIAK